MTQTTLSVRMDKKDKEELENFCSAVGMNVSVAVNMFAKAVIREQRLPFEVAIKAPNKQSLKALNDVKHGRNLSKDFSSVAELMEDLNDQD